MDNELLTLADLKMLDPEKTVFTKENGGYVSVKTENGDFSKIKMNRALPFRMPDEYICITDRDNKEIGIIRDLNAFSGEQQQIIRDELSRLYYSPEIIRIVSAKDRMGFMYFEAVTNAGKREFAVRDVSKNIRFIDPDMRTAVQIRDVDGNRYIIPDFMKFDTSSSKKIEAFLV